MGSATKMALAAQDWEKTIQTRFPLAERKEKPRLTEGMKQALMGAALGVYFAALIGVGFLCC